LLGQLDLLSNPVIGPVGVANLEGSALKLVRAGFDTADRSYAVSGIHLAEPGAQR
jgi:hypothetical protein